MFLYISSIRAIDFNIVLCQQLLITNTQGGLPVCTPGVYRKNVASETYNFQSGCQRLSQRVLFHRQCWRKVVRRKIGDRGPALQVLGENDRGQLGHLHRVNLVRLVVLSSEIELASSVIELTEKFLFDYVRLPNQLKNNRTTAVRLSSIDFSFGLVRLATSGKAKGINPVIVYNILGKTRPIPKTKR